MSSSTRSPRSAKEQIIDDDEEIQNHLRIVGDYKHGSIKRIKLIHFLTYTEMEFSPKPRLNMVVGVNGTGKSSILCAICLGLGGEPRMLGRASEIETFIQNGEQEAYIELELANEYGEDPIITRTIRNHGGEKQKSSSFTWDGEVISGKKVRERVTAEFQIQIENLCTFLPQEKVGSFSGFDSKRLLMETEKSLSPNHSLFNTHMELIELQNDLHGGDDQVESLEEKLNQLKVEVKRMEREVQRMEQLQRDQEQAEMLKKKIVWLQCDALHDECMQLKEEKDQQKQVLETVLEEMQPLEEARVEAQEKLAETQKKYQQFEKLIMNHKQEMDRQKSKYEKHDDLIEETLAEINTIESRRGELENKTEDARERVQQLQEQVDASPATEDLEAEYNKARAETRDFHPMYQAKKKEFDDLQKTLETVMQEIKNTERKMSKINDEKANRCRHVLSKSQDMRNAYDFIQANRNMFRKEVIGPIAAEVIPKSSNSAAYLEQHVPNSVLKTFIVQDKSDYDLLYQKVRQERNCPINIIQIDRIPPRKPRLYSDATMAMLKRDHGIIGYLDELIDAPEIVIEALRSTASIEKVLVGSDKTQDSMDNRNLAGLLSDPEREGGRMRGYCIFTSQHEKSFKYTSQISSYSHKPSLRVDDISAAKWLQRGIDEVAKQRVEQELNSFQEQMEEILPQKERIEKELDEVRVKAQESQSRVKDSLLHLKSTRALKTKWESAKRKLQALEAQLEVDSEDDKHQKVDQLNQRIRHSLKALKAHSDSYKLMLSATVKASGAQLQVEVASTEERSCSEKFAEASAKKESLFRDFQKVKEALSKKKSLYKQLIEKARAEAPLQDEAGNDMPLKETLQVEFGQFDSIQKAEAALEEINGRIRNTVADTNVIRLYEMKKAEIDTTQDQLDGLKNCKDEKASKLRRVAESWVTAVEMIVDKVDLKFSLYMSELGCVGAVRLRKGKPGSASNTNEESKFEEYGVEIMVSFREGVKPSVLSARVQSGGERSVSTIMYLMAMQDMMVSPFRCVDEINQGLDERNERLVFKRIVENSTKPPGKKGPTDHCGQYWLITPKLLPNLIDMEVEAMNVVCVFNGPYNLKRSTDWDVEKLVAMRKRQKTQGTEENDDEE